MARKVNATQIRLLQLIRETPPSRFLDYRHFFRHLKDRLSEEFNKYTYGQFSTDLGFSSPHVSYILINEVRKLSPTYLGTILSTLRLSPKEKKYLRVLVDFTHAKSGDERQRLFEKLVDAKTDTAASETERLQLQFFTHWLHAAIFELFDLDVFDESPEWIVRQFIHPVTVDRVEASLTLLKSLGLVERDETGRLVKTKSTISASDSVLALAKAGFHMQMMDRARDALNLSPASQREFGAVTLSLSDKHFNRLNQDLALFKRYAIHLSELSEQKTKVVQLNFQLFPFTQVSEKQEDMS